MMDDGGGPEPSREGSRRLSAPVVPGYEISTRLGRGAFGVVYLAWQPAFSRQVAVKVLMDTLDDRDAARLLRECQALGTASTHPNIVTVHDAGFTEEGRGFLVMEYLGGGSLADRLVRDGALAWQDVTRIGIRLAGALETAHRAGVLHRDIKPDNVLLSDYGEPKLADFGIARLVGTATRTGPVYASILYAAPEVLSGQAKSTPASDVYALSGTLLTLLTGHPPFEPETDEPVSALIARIVSNPPDLRVPDVPVGLLAVLGRALAKDPADRPATAEELGDALREVQQEEEVAVTEMAVGTPTPSAPRPAAAPRQASAPARAPAATPGRSRRRPPTMVIVPAAAVAVAVLIGIGAALRPPPATHVATSGGARVPATLRSAETPSTQPPTSPTSSAPPATPATPAKAIPAVAPPARCAPSVAYGQTVACTIGGAGAVQRHDFTAAAGDHVYVRAVRLSGDFTFLPSYSVLGPGGAPDCPDRPDCPVKTAGRHTIVVRDSMNKSTGDYALYLQRTDDPAGCGRIAIGESADGTLQPPGSMACAFFTAAAADRVSVTAVSTGDGQLQFPELSIISVDTGRTSCSTQSNCQLDQGGRYIVLGASSALINQTGPFRITVACLAGPCRSS